jgi:hypothetical protein
MTLQRELRQAVYVLVQCPPGCVQAVSDLMGGARLKHANTPAVDLLGLGLAPLHDVNCLLQVREWNAVAQPATIQAYMVSLQEMHMPAWP